MSGYVIHVQNTRYGSGGKIGFCQRKKFGISESTKHVKVGGEAFRGSLAG